ncbi:MAG: glycosyltransferase family 4 protein [Candidatus Aenigmatarchaeota archaeon]
MKILFVGLTPPEEGGVERCIYELSSRIKDSHVLTQRSSICKNKISFPLFSIKSILFKNILLFLFFLLYLPKIMIKKKFDIVHIHNHFLFFFIIPLKLRGYKVVLTIHGLKGFKFYDNKLLWFFIKNMIRLANGVICITPRIKKVIESINVNSIYIPNGVNLKLYPRRKRRKENEILFLGRIHKQKGLVYLLEAFMKIKNKIPTFKLRIVGKINDYAYKLKERFCDKQIIWEGFILDDKKKIELLTSCYCIVLPSLWEGFPLTLLEALASGRPVIVSSLPQIKEILNEGEVIFVKPRSSKDIAKKILLLVKNKKLAEEIGIKGKEKSKIFSWERIAEEHIKFYQKLLK